MLGNLITMGGDVPHLLVDMSVMVAFPTPITYPRRNILDDHKRLPMPEIFTPTCCVQPALTTADTDFTCHIYWFFRFHTPSP